MKKTEKSVETSQSYVISIHEEKDEFFYREQQKQPTKNKMRMINNE